MVCGEKGLTLLEMVLSMSIMAIIFAVLVPQFRNIRLGWDSRAGAAEAMQNGRVMMDHIARNLAGAVRITAVSDSSENDGYIEFEDNDGSILKYEISDNYVQFGSSDELSDLAGPVESMVFTCHDVCDLDTPTTDVNAIRFVEVQATLANSAELGRDNTMRTSVFLRTNPWGAETVDARVDHDHDDAEETDSGEVLLEGKELELGRREYVGFRFAGLDVPRNASIEKASLTVQAGDWNSETTAVLIWGENSDDAAGFESTSSNLSGREPTTASVAWNDIEPWTKNRFYETPDLSSIVGQIVSRPGWSSGNSMVIVLESTDPGGMRLIFARDARLPKASLLHVEYSTGGTGILP